MRTFAINTKVYERVMTEETLAKLRATRRANQADFTLTFTEKSGNKFIISQAALEELTLDKNSATFDVITDSPNPAENGAYIIILEGDSGAFFKGKKVKASADGKEGKKSKSITYEKLIAELQQLGLVPSDEEIVVSKTKVFFDFEKVEEEIESGDPNYKILSAWKLVASTKTKGSEEDDNDENLPDARVETAEVEAVAEQVEEDDFK